MRQKHKGLLWFDDNPHKTLDEIVREAVRRFKSKTGESANFVAVNPRALVGRENRVVDNTIDLISDPVTLNSHFLVGRKEKRGAP